MGVRPAFFVPTFVRMSRVAFPIMLFAATLVAICSSPSAHAQRRAGRPLDTLGEEVSQKKGWEILSAFRRLGIAGDYRLNFQLRIMPRSEKTRVVPGLLLGTMNDVGPLSRVDVAVEPAQVSDKGKLIPAEVRRLLLQNGLFATAAEAATFGEDPEPQLIPPQRYFEPVAGSDFTVFDLLMPFNFWQSFKYEGRTTLRSRPAHVFWLYPPDEDELMREHVSKVKIYLDEEFNALNRVEVYGPDEKHIKTISVVAFKIVDGQAVLSQIDVRDETTRGKTRFKVLDAALGVELPDWVFEFEGLNRNLYGTELASVRPEEGAEAEAAPTTVQ